MLGYTSSMTDYERGVAMAQNDMARHGILHAMDKAEVLDGPVGEGYNEVVTKKMQAHLTQSK